MITLATASYQGNNLTDAYHLARTLIPPDPNTTNLAANIVSPVPSHS